MLRIGRLALSAGTGSYRVKSHMTRAARALGLDRIAAHVTLTEITATSYRGPIFRTELTEVRSIGINADRLAQLERFSATLPAGADLDEVDAELDRIARRPPLYGAFLNALWAGIACAAFAFLNHGGLVECGAVLVAAALGQGVRRAMLHRGINQFGVTMLAAAVASVAYLGLVLGLSALAGVEGGHEAGYVSAVLFLVPGFALVTGALDLAKLDFSAGVARVTYALMILASAALAVWGVSAAAGLAPDPVPAPVLAEPLLFGLRAVASFLGVLGFALMFNSPWAMALGAASIGMVANVGRLLLVDADVVPQAAAAAAALLVGAARGDGRARAARPAHHGVGPGRGHHGPRRHGVPGGVRVQHRRDGAGPRLRGRGGPGDRRARDRARRRADAHRPGVDVRAVGGDADGPAVWSGGDALVPWATQALRGVLRGDVA